MRKLLGLFADALPTLLLLYPLWSAFHVTDDFSKLMWRFVGIDPLAVACGAGLLVAWQRIRARVRRRLSTERREEIIPTLRPPQSEILAAIGRPVASVLIAAFVVLPAISAIRYRHDGRYEMPYDSWGTVFFDLCAAALLASMIIHAGLRQAGLACLKRESAKWLQGVHAAGWIAACLALVVFMQLARAYPNGGSLSGGIVIALAAMFVGIGVPIQWRLACLAYPVLEPESGGLMAMLKRARPDGLRLASHWRWIARTRWLFGAGAILMCWLATQLVGLQARFTLNPYTRAVHAAGRDPVEAKRHILEAERWMPRNPNVASLRGVIEHRQGDYGASVKSFRRALALKPEDRMWGPWRIHSWLLRSIAELSDFASLEAAANQALVAETDEKGEWPSAMHWRSNYMARRAQARAGLGRLAEAKADLAEALKLDPENDVTAEIKEKIRQAEASATGEGAPDGKAEEAP